MIKGREDPKVSEFMRVARAVARLSPAGVKVGCIVTAPNAFGDDIIVVSRWNVEYPIKEHAEYQVLQAMKMFIPNWWNYELTMYVTTQPCLQCSQTIVESGIVKEVYYQNPWWDEAGKEVLEKADIPLIRVRQAK